VPWEFNTQNHNNNKTMALKHNIKKDSNHFKLIIRMKKELADSHVATIVITGLPYQSVMLHCMLYRLTASNYVQVATSDFHLWVLHPVAHLSNWFLMMPSIATKFQYVNSPFDEYMGEILHAQTQQK
jgi:hypothetical protein